MISYKVKGIILAVIISLASIMMPFSVYADTISTSNITYNYYLTDVVDSTSQFVDKNYIYDVDFIFDKSYLGWVSVSMVTSYIYDTGDTRQVTYTKAIYVNGNTAKTSIVISSNFTGTNGSPLTSMSITINNSNVTPLADLSSLQDIINLLQDIDDHISIDILGELQDIVANTSLANDYLEAISLYRQWNFPIESMPMIMYPLLNYDVYGIKEDNNYFLPIFKISNGFTMGRLLATRNTYYLIFATDLNIANYGTGSAYSFEYYIDIPEGVTINKFELLYNSFPLNTFQGKMIKVTFTYTGNSYLYWRFKNITGDHYYMPLYYGETSNKLLSTDFALNYGLSNNLLDNLQIIANGTSSSSSAASDLESEASEYSEIADDVIGVENGLTSNFETEVNKIDLNTGLNVFGGNFMTSATWVRTQFDRLTENTPYGSLVVYGLTLGFALLMLGKVFL